MFKGAGKRVSSSDFLHIFNSGLDFRNSEANKEKYSSVGPRPVPSSLRNSNSRTDFGEKIKECLFIIFLKYFENFFMSVIIENCEAVFYDIISRDFYFFLM